MLIWAHFCPLLLSVVLLCVQRWYLRWKLANSTNQGFPPLENSPLPRKQILRHITDSNPGSQNSHPCPPPPGHIRSLSMSLCVYRVVWGGGEVLPLRAPKFC